MNTNKILSADDVTVTLSQGISQKKNVVIHLKLIAPKDAFSFTTRLRSFGDVPDIEKFLTEGGRNLLLGYFAKVERDLLSSCSQEQFKEK